MLYDEIKKVHPYATLLTFRVGGGEAILTAAHPMPGREPVRQTVVLSRPVRRKNGIVMVPATLFRDGMFTYLTQEEGAVVIERAGHVIRLALDGVHAYDDSGVVMVDAAVVISRLDVDYEFVNDEYNVIIETRKMGFRKLTPAEERQPYAKYYHRYWATPLHERADFKSWSKKAALYSGDNMQPPEKMLHISQVNRIMDKNYRENEWTEGWCLFDDGSTVMCAKTEFPGVTAEMFQWWFAWHVLEDLRYMLWCPPSHFGVTPALELRQRVKDPNLSLFEKTHDISVHQIYESIGIDYLSFYCSSPVDYFEMDFHDPQYRGLTDGNAALLKGDKGMAAICGAERMLHFFVENEDGTGGTCYTNFWFGVKRDENGVWHGVKEEEGGKSYELMTRVMSIAQHANKEFPLLASFLPELYAEEGHKPL